MALPDHDGHDLRAVPGSPDLIFSTHGHVWLFNRDQPAVRRHPELGDLALVKGIDIHPVSGRVLLIQAADKTWWSDTFLLRHPEGRVKLEKGRLYKGRWISLP